VDSPAQQRVVGGLVLPRAACGEERRVGGGTGGRHDESRAFGHVAPHGVAEESRAPDNGAPRQAAMMAWRANPLRLRDGRFICTRGP
jgi:hypothetical protein